MALVDSEERIILDQDPFVLSQRLLGQIRFDIDLLIIKGPIENCRIYQGKQSYNYVKTSGGEIATLSDRHKTFLENGSNTKNFRVQFGTEGVRGWNWIASAANDKRVRFLISRNGLLLALHEKRIYPGRWVSGKPMRSDEWPNVTGLVLEAKSRIK